MIKIFIIVVLLSIPLVLIYLDIIHPEVDGRFLFSLFVVGAMAERIWETFYTSKEKDVHKYQGDWTLPATIFAFFLVSLLLIFEFYNSAIKNLSFVLLGLAFFFCAGLLRLWSMKTLGEHWSIHLVEKEHMTKPVLVKRGPYGYIRHPIYLGAILELIGIALIANAFIYLLLIFFINIPLYVIRSIYEEKRNIKKFGEEEYSIYKKNVSFMIPFKSLKKVK
jgi:methyltransferase